MISPELNNIRISRYTFIPIYGPSSCHNFNRFTYVECTPSIGSMTTVYISVWRRPFHLPVFKSFFSCLGSENKGHCQSRYYTVFKWMLLQRYTCMKIDIFQYVEKAKASNKHFEFILARRITTIEWWYIQERHTIPWYCQDFTSTNVPAVWSKRWKPGYLVQIKLHQQRWLNERIEITFKQSWHEQTRSVWYLSHNFKAKYRLSLYQFLLNMALHSKST